MFRFRIIVTPIILFLFTIAAHAVPIQATYTIDANTEEPGLRVATTPLAPNPFSFDLSVGESEVFDLFEITVASGEGGTGADPDDTNNPQPISVQFGFDQPVDGMATITGTTAAARPFDDSNYLAGVVNWNGPINFSFGDGGQIQIALSDETFASGDLINLGLPAESATVQATLTLVDDGTVAVPAPGALALFGLGVLGIAAVVRRRSMQSV